MDPVKQEDGPLALDGDVAADLDDPLVLVVASVQEPDNEDKWSHVVKLFPSEFSMFLFPPNISNTLEDL